MHVARAGFTPLKGARHLEQPHVDLGPDGPIGDRLLCLVDPRRDRVLRTVEHPSLMRVVASVLGDHLTLRIGEAVVEGVLEPTGVVRRVDYWGRSPEVELLDGPWAEAVSRHLGREAVLARPALASDVVYGGSVSLVTTSSLDRLAAALGRPVDGSRFRPTFVVATAGSSAHVEDDWVGRELCVGDAVVRIRGAVPRCAVVDVDPVSGARDAPVLQTIAGYRRGEGALRRAQEPCFGVDADVVRPGRVVPLAPVVLGKD